jgi:hypothetical protein
MLLLGSTGVGKVRSAMRSRGTAYSADNAITSISVGIERRCSREDLSLAYSSKELDFIHGVLERGSCSKRTFSACRKISVCSWTGRDLLRMICLF